MHLFLQLLQRGPLLIPSLIPSLPPASDLSLGSLHELLRPVPLDEACWVGTCVALFLCRLRGGDLYGLPRPGLCVSGPVALVSAPQARPLRPGSSVDWFWLPVPAPSVSGLVALASSHHLPSFSRSLCALLPAVLRGLCVLPRFVRLPCLCTPGLPSAQGLCGLLGFVCCASLSYLGLPSGLKGLCALVTFVPFRGILSIPEPTVCLGPQSVSC